MEPQINPSIPSIKLTKFITAVEAIIRINIMKNIIAKDENFSKNKFNHPENKSKDITVKN